MANMFSSMLNIIASKFKDDPSKMIIMTGVIGWGLSSTAQILGILFNSKLSDKQRSFLVPQEFADALTNIGLYFVFTLFAKNVTTKLYKTGKFAPESVRKFLNDNKAIYGDKVGKFDFNLDVISKNVKTFPKNEYEIYKNFGSTLATVGAGVVASNVLTPLIRNKNASRKQQKYVDYVSKTQPYKSSDGMRI